MPKDDEEMTPAQFHVIARSCRLFAAASDDLRDALRTAHTAICVLKAHIDQYCDEGQPDDEDGGIVAAAQFWTGQAFDPPRFDPAGVPERPTAALPGGGEVPIPFHQLKKD